MATTVESLADRLGDQALEDAVILNYKGAGKKLDKEEDIKSICQDLDKKQDVTVFCLQGNTLGSDAAKFLGQSLSKCTKLERLLCEDIFTGRMKTDIPVSLGHFSYGLITSGCQLVELDFSGNAFGELAINAMYKLLTASTCFSLKELRLHNTGLGPSGGVRLAKALLECLEKSEGNFRLEVFVCGRSRLENEGAISLAEFFAQSPDLLELVIPQDGIFKEGIAAIGRALVNCPSLKILNINDNILSPQGAADLAPSLEQLQSLEVLNIGDCVLKSEGAIHIANAIGDLVELRELHLGHNEIEIEAGLQIVEAVANKPNLQVLELDGNCFGNEGISQIEARMEELGLIDALCAFSEDEADDEDYGDEGNDEGGEGFTFEDFATTPTLESLLALPEDPRVQAKEYLSNFQCLDHSGLLRMFVKFASAASDGSDEAVSIAAEICTPVLDQMMQLSYDPLTLVNLFAVHFGFVKDENRQVKPPRDVSPLLLVLARFRNHFPDDIATPIKTFAENMGPLKCSKTLLPRVQAAFAAF